MRGVEAELRGLELARSAAPGLGIELRRQLQRCREREELAEEDAALAEATALLHRGEQDAFLPLGPLEARGTVAAATLAELWRLAWGSDPLLSRLDDALAQEVSEYVFEREGAALRDRDRAVIVRRMAHVAALSAFVQDYHPVLKEAGLPLYFQAFRQLAEEKFELHLSMPQTPLAVAKTLVITLVLRALIAFRGPRPDPPDSGLPSPADSSQTSHF